MHTVVICLQHCRCKGSSRMRYPCNIADGQIAMPCTAVITTEADHVVTVACSVFKQHLTEADGVCSLPADNGISDRIVADTAVRVSAGDNAVVKNDLLAEIGAKHAPQTTVEDIVLPDYVERDYLLVNPFSRPGTPLEEVNAVVLHYVGNPGTTAKANRDYFNTLALGRDGTYASSHFVVGLEGEVIQCIPLTEIAYASNDRNGDTIAIEVCHPDEEGQYGPVTYDRVVELTAFLCREFDLDPETEVIRHYDVTGKLCPRYYVEQPTAWEQLKTDVAAAMAAE